MSEKDWEWHKANNPFYNPLHTNPQGDITSGSSMVLEHNFDQAETELLSPRCAYCGSRHKKDKCPYCGASR